MPIRPEERPSGPALATVLSVPFLAYAFVAQGLSALGWRLLPRPFLPAWVIWSLLGVIVAYWVLRNVPVYPLSVLAP